MMNENVKRSKFVKLVFLYKIVFLISCVFVSIPCAAIFIIGLFHFKIVSAAICGSICAFWWVAYWYLRKPSRISCFLSFLLVNIFWWPLLYITIQRIKFIIENGGRMEEANGDGSPMAFLVNMIGEQMLFLPITATVVIGVLSAIYFLLDKYAIKRVNHENL